MTSRRTAKIFTIILSPTTNHLVQLEIGFPGSHVHSACVSPHNALDAIREILDAEGLPAVAHGIAGLPRDFDVIDDGDDGWDAPPKP